MFLLIFDSIDDVIWIPSIEGSSKVLHTLIAYAMWVSGALLESGHTFSKTQAMYVVCVSAFIVTNNLS